MACSWSMCKITCKGQESIINMYDWIPALLDNPFPQAWNEVVEHWRRHMLCKPVSCDGNVLHSCFFGVMIIWVGWERLGEPPRKGTTGYIWSVGPLRSGASECIWSGGPWEVGLLDTSGLVDPWENGATVCIWSGGPWEVGVPLLGIIASSAQLVEPES